MIHKGALLNLLEAFGCKIHRNRIAKRADDAIGPGIAHFSREIKLRFAAAALLRPLQRAGSEFRRYRHEDLILINTKLRGLHGQRQFHFGCRREYRLFELAFAIFGGEHAEIFWRIVAFANSQARPGRQIHFHVNATPASIARRVRAVIAEQVVAGIVALHGLEYFSEIPDIEEGTSAGISCERRKSFARILAGLRLLEDGGACVHRIAGRRADGSIAARDLGHEPA